VGVERGSIGAPKRKTNEKGEIPRREKREKVGSRVIEDK